MPKKSNFLPPPKPHSYPEEAAVLTKIFEKEPLITFPDLLDKYGDTLSEEDAVAGLFGLFKEYLTGLPEDDSRLAKIKQAQKAAMQLDILCPADGKQKPTRQDTEVRKLARASFANALEGLPAGLGCFVTFGGIGLYDSSVYDEGSLTMRLLSSANQGKLDRYTMLTDAVSRNLPKLLPDEENEVFVGKSGGRSVSTIVTMDFPKNVMLDGGGCLTNFDKAILNGVSSLLVAGTIYFTIPMLYHAMVGSSNPSMREEAVQAIRDRLEFMRRSTITLDRTEEAAAHFIRDGQDLQSLTISQYLLPMNRMNAVLNGRDVEAYFLIETPPLFKYASSKRQISLVDMELLNVHFEEPSPLAGVRLNNTAVTIVLKNYLLTRIEGMKNQNNRLQSRKILFSSLYQELGEEDATKQRRQRLRSYTEIYLEYLTAQHYISGYTFTKNGRFVDGVEILLDRTTGKPSPAPELSLPEEQKSNRIKPKKKKRNVIR